jgi:hypothetical protein
MDWVVAILAIRCTRVLSRLLASLQLKLSGILAESRALTDVSAANGPKSSRPLPRCAYSQISALHIKTNRCDIHELTRLRNYWECTGKLAVFLFAKTQRPLLTPHSLWDVA